MSIPTPFNPLGTLGGGVELPYVQPVKTGFGMNEHSNDPSFGFSVSAGSEGVYTGAKWYPFASGKKLAISPSVHADIIIEFARPLRIDAVDFAAQRKIGGFDMGALNVYASEDGGDWHFVGGMTTTEDVPLTNEYCANHLALNVQGLYKHYKFELLAGLYTFFGIKDMIFTAFCKP